MANNTRNQLLKLTNSQLIALAMQKKAASYLDAHAMTKGQLIALLKNVEGVLKPVKTWEEDMLDNDQRVIEEIAGTVPGTVEVS